MNKHFVEFCDLDNLFLFTKILNKEIRSEVTASYDRFVIDAKSFVGMISIYAHPITLEIISDNTDEIRKFNDICKKYCPAQGEQWNNGL